MTAKSRKKLMTHFAVCEYIAVLLDRPLLLNPELTGRTR
jgi:hypothetical protein